MLRNIPCWLQFFQHKLLSEGKKERFMTFLTSTKEPRQFSGERDIQKLFRLFKGREKLYFLFHSRQSYQKQKI